ncbi:hypothetical protein GUJ93_ZPchr0002g24921 [Zizania palustris]|uniref:Uncharacterized protein n=1 Tax=Zizania palustris TaxID=103762 RepID=A0A8J5S1T9_ZIZPA|nr:hypothetical protein GUJ93_ZPchr0002g24921 [Zizania palustris]
MAGLAGDDLYIWDESDGEDFLEFGSVGFDADDDDEDEFCGGFCVSGFSFVDHSRLSSPDSLENRGTESLHDDLLTDA